jgi:hypothetical protein
VKLLDRLAKSYLKRRGYTIGGDAIGRRGDYTLLGYNDPAGNFDYSRYVAIQTEGNKRKIDQVWADKPTIDFICDYLRASGNKASRGLCHGSRNGAEVGWFADNLGAEVIGTDISDTAEQFGLIQWDFHETNPDWIGKFDFVYTNSHDHAYDPRKSFAAWVAQLSPTGKLFLEHTSAHTASKVSPLDPFGVDPKLLPYVLLEFSEGNYSVTRILQPPHRKRGRTIFVFVVESMSKTDQQ